jgi:LEA14-like dessication related protein
LRHRARVAVLIGVAALTACADSPRLDAPKVAVDSVRLERITGTEASFLVTLNLTNPNAREMAVDAIEASVTVEDVPLGSATLKSPLRLPANGEAMAALQAKSGLAAVLRVGAEIAQRAQEQRGSGQPTRIRYAVTGTATLEGGWAIPFSRAGDFRIGPQAR